MGSKTTETLIESSLMIATKAVDMLVKIKDVDALQKEVKTTTSWRSGVETRPVSCPG